MQLSPVLFNLGDTVDGVKDTIGTVTSFFTDMGKWCAEVLDAGLSVFQSLTMSGFDMLQLKNRRFRVCGFSYNCKYCCKCVDALFWSVYSVVLFIQSDRPDIRQQKPDGHLEYGEIFH